MPPAEPTARGRCECGAVRYRINGPLRPILACHCRQCQRTSGNYVAATNCAESDLILERSESLRWYDSSPIAQRGFCGICGGNLFYKIKDGDRVSIMAGTLDQPTGLTIARHIHTASAADFHVFDDHIPRDLGDDRPESLR